jgi:adenylate cyclase
MIADRLSETAVDIEDSHFVSSRANRIVAVSVAIATDQLVAAPGDRRIEMRWREIRAKLIDPQIAGHLGQIVSASATGLTVEFRNAVNAVRCAIEMQRDAHAANAGAGDAPPLELRVGVHATEGGAKGPQLFDEAIKLALSLEQAAEAGQILISAATAAQVAGAPDLVTERLGRTPAPRAAEGEPAFRVVSAQVGAEHGRSKPNASVAVLTFSGAEAPQDGNAADGIVEDITRALSTIQDLIVVSRASTVYLRGAEPRTIGRQLAVRYVVTVKSRRAEGRLSVSARLVDTETGRDVWHKRFAASERDVFNLQEKIARRIASALLPNLSSAELQRIASKPPENLDAYDLVLQATHRMYRLEREDFAAAREMLERALKLEPGYAAAYTYLAMWHMLNIGQGYSGDENRESAEMLRAANHALERDPADAHALALLGHCKAWLYRDYESAVDLFEQAYIASPNAAFVWGWSSPICSYLGDGAAGVARAERALRLCPIGPHSYFYRAVLALGHYTLGHYADAARWSRRSMAVYPQYEANLRFLAASLAAGGRLQEARRVARSLLELRPDFSVGRFAARYAYRDPQRNALLGEHLRLAGLPE